MRALLAGRLGLRAGLTGRHADACRRLSATLEPGLQAELDRVHAAMADAVESTRFIADSAQQAYLEAEPSERQLPEAYLLRYLGFAHSQVARALADYDRLAQRLGVDRMRQVEQQDRLALALADTLLARDHLKARIGAEEEKAAAKQKGGLRRSDLTHCD